MVSEVDEKKRPAGRFCFGETRLLAQGLGMFATDTFFNECHSVPWALPLKQRNRLHMRRVREHIHDTRRD